MTGRVTVAALWLLAVARLTIADVWDETNGLVAFGDATRPLGDMVRFVLTQSVGFWRPLPTLFAALVIRWSDPEVAWRLLRAVNAAMLLGALAIFIRTLRDWDGRDERRDTLFTAAFLGSAGAVICATWFANIFDVTSLLLIACGTALLPRGRFVTAGVLFGVAFFCKETAILALPFLGMLVAADRLRVRDGIRTAIPAIVLGATYFALRGRIIPFGSAADTHQFEAARLLPAIRGLVDSFWTQSMWGDGPGVFGAVCFVVSAIAMRGWRARLAFLGLVAATALIYWDMTSLYQQRQVLHYLMFCGRLFLIPVTLTLFVLLLQRRRASVAVLLVPLLFGAVVTYRQYERFQRSYRNLYRFARTYEPKPLRVHYPMKPLSDPRRGIEIGDHPDAEWKLDPVNGKLVRTR